MLRLGGSASGDGLANGIEFRRVSICSSGDGLTNRFESWRVSICPLWMVWL